MISLWIITGVALLVSLAADRRKTQAAVFKGLKMFVGVIPMLLGVLAAVSLVLTSVTPRGPRKITGLSGCREFGLGNT
jgi:hypothetical protein